jgi:hypothetical protein
MVLQQLKELGDAFTKKGRNTRVGNTRTKARGPALIGVLPSFAGEDEVRVLWLLALRLVYTTTPHHSNHTHGNSG